MNYVALGAAFNPISELLLRLQKSIEIPGIDQGLRRVGGVERDRGSRPGVGPSLHTATSSRFIRLHGATGCAAVILVSALRLVVESKQIWDLRDAWTDDDNVGMAMINHAASGRAVDVVVGRSSRSAGVSLYRQAWATSKVDLAKLKDVPGVKFVHKNGFYAVISSEVSDTDLAKMLAAAVTSA